MKLIYLVIVLASAALLSGCDEKGTGTPGKTYTVKQFSQGKIVGQWQAKGEGFSFYPGNHNCNFYVVSSDKGVSVQGEFTIEEN